MGAGLRKKVFGEALDWGGASLELARDMEQGKLLESMRVILAETPSRKIWRLKCPPAVAR